MEIENLRSLLLWCAGINYMILLVWFGVLIVAHDWMYRLHTRWFTLSRETFDAIHYASMAMYKIANLVFFVVPYIALWLIAPVP